MKSRLTDHQKRCLGAVAALTDAQSNKVGFHSRYDIGTVVYASWCQGVQLKPMLRLWSLGLVKPRSAEAVELYQLGECRCGCDRWGITDEGRDALKTLNVKVPTLNMKMRPVPSLEQFKQMLGLDDDPADDWKKK